MPANNGAEGMLVQVGIRRPRKPKGIDKLSVCSGKSSPEELHFRVLIVADEGPGSRFSEASDQLATDARGTTPL